MFESAALGMRYSDNEYKQMEDTLRIRLFQAQRECYTHGVPVLIVLAGVDGAGRGDVVNLLSEWMDAKGIRNHTFWLHTDEERARPEAWRYWRKLPAAGEIGVFFGGWYDEAIRRACCGDMKEKTFQRAMRRWARLERTLTASGTLIVKLWLHIGRRVHKERIQDRKRHQGLRYFAPCDKAGAEHYDAFVAAAARAITLTDSADAPWTIIDAGDGHFRNASVARTLIAAMESAVAARTGRPGEEAPAQPEPEAPARRFALDAVDLTITCPHDAYKKELARLQDDVRGLTYKAYKKGISSTLVFEGWDAAGKGGAIRRLTAGVDARIARVIPISAPTDEELAHNYLWRFWRHIPRAGFVTVYDRSWYGRVLVERVENLTPPEDWKRAYAEINDFEEQLAEGNNILLKYWLHISEDEQLKRFKEREEIPWKRYKITGEDWRNRERRPAYLEAADEMFMRTSTEYAPWHIIPAEDKKHARLEVLRLYRAALKKALRRAR